MVVELDKFALQEKSVKTDEVVVARRKIQEMVDTNIKENGPLSLGTILEMLWNRFSSLKHPRLNSYLTTSLLSFV